MACTLLELPTGGVGVDAAKRFNSPVHLSLPHLQVQRLLRILMGAHFLSSLLFLFAVSLCLICVAPYDVDCGRTPTRVPDSSSAFFLFVLASLYLYTLLLLLHFRPFQLRLVLTSFSFPSHFGCSLIRFIPGNRRQERSFKVSRLCSQTRKERGDIHITASKLTQTHKHTRRDWDSDE